MNNFQQTSIYQSPSTMTALSGIEAVHAMYNDAGAIKKGALIFADSGQGKSYLAKHYVKKHPPTITHELTTIPIFHFSFKSPKKTGDEILKLLIVALGSDVPKRSATSADLELQFIHLLKEKQVELIIFDEIQALVTTYDGIEFQRIIKFFCWVLDCEDIRCSFVMMGTESAKRFMTFGKTAPKLVDTEHFSRRMRRPIPLRLLRPKKQEWLDCVNWFIGHNLLPAVSFETHKSFLCRLYLAYYYESYMSTLRDLLLNKNCQQCVNIESLIDTVRENFEAECKNDINFFDSDDISDAKVFDEINRITKTAKMPGGSDIQIGLNA
ncbi:TniB family NTP-binding protein [Alteromonas sp. 1_MG-2023]|uniref:TniB family NTP-binding protein n=1 Tax=Alteromonas sp. 1_MG-2023 TaxID=3062669 RepID=UPI0026E4271A|nr:TniB family NTP-binding protein [Alteromonas sp. 1_MG-2023]MDO6477369.1 TniB family NTP-binding protein [Alteromonas sp. 1_MG-2023]